MHFFKSITTTLLILSTFVPAVFAAPMVIGGGDPALASGAGAAFMIGELNGNEVAFIPGRANEACHSQVTLTKVCQS
jgi:hypothetical protein